MSKSLMFKMNGDAVLTQITRADVSGDFLFVDKRTGTVYSFTATSQKCSVVGADTEVKWSATFLDSPYYLKIISFIKKGKINTTYEPQILTVQMTTGNNDLVAVSYYAKDQNLEKDGLWIDVDAATDGRLCISEGETGTTNQATNFATVASLEMTHSKMRRVCQIVVNGAVLHEDHILI